MNYVYDKKQLSWIQTVYICTFSNVNTNSKFNNSETSEDITLLNISEITYQVTDFQTEINFSNYKNYYLGQSCDITVQY